MKIREEVCKDTCNRNRLYTFYSCNQCGKEYKKQTRFEGSSNQEHYCSKQCHTKSNISGLKIEVSCAHCGVLFLKDKSDLKGSKSGLYFCCRKHKDIGQTYIKEIQPEHYGTASPETGYRDKAFKHYRCECEICKFSIKEALEVHHIDKNRCNDSIDNLVILCANCHLLVHRNIIEVQRA